MTMEWWRAWGERWLMKEEEERARWIQEETLKAERWGYEGAEEQWAYKDVLDQRLAAVWVAAWKEAEAEDRQHRLAMALSELDG